MTFISFIKFKDLQEVKQFCVYNAIPEREDNILGELLDGTLVYPVYEYQEDSGDLVVTATIN